MTAQHSGKRNHGGCDGGRRPYIEQGTVIKVRFHEVDIMGVVWHGNYIGYFEEARRAFGRRHGIDWPVFVDQGLLAPVVSVWAEYHSPARMGDVLEATARLYRSDSVKFEFEYEIRQSSDRKLVASGGTVQVLVTPGQQLVLTWPPFFVKLFEQWESSWILP